MMYYFFILAILGTSVVSSANAVKKEFRDDFYGEASLSRLSRAASCKKWHEWQCRDETCIPLESKCDGVYDCPDKSDESHAVCRNMKCPAHLFQCTYGACVDGTAPCDGQKDCADNSDELLRRCRNQTSAFSRDVTCGNGHSIPLTSRCDGTVDCADGSDEILATCAEAYCPSFYFRCAYGACVDHDAACDGKFDCADKSDEDDILCNKTQTISHKSNTITHKPNIITNEEDYFASTSQPNLPTEKLSSMNCKLPEYPEHGYYVGEGFRALPGDSLPNCQINFTCNDGYRLVGNSIAYCFYGQWLSEFPKCAKFCKLETKANVNYQCVLSGDSTGTRKCEEYEPLGTQATHQCAPNYRPDDYDLGYMVCREDGWANVPRCLPDCGKVTPIGTPYIAGGRTAERGELPWHTGIYAKAHKNNVVTYNQICGGSLISRTVVLSAAHCFWDEDQPYSEDKYAVAVGKLYRDWNDKNDEPQKIDVKELHISEYFMGSANQFQGDIALLVLSYAVTYKSYIRPVCMSFNHELANEQLHVGNNGKVAGWGMIDSDGTIPTKLQVVEIPYVDPGVCKDRSPKEFKPFITTDKFCAGYDNGTALCRGDSGGGLMFQKQGSDRYYMRGIVSTAPHSEDECNTNALITFTNVVVYEDFIKQHWHGDDV